MLELIAMLGKEAATAAASKALGSPLMKLGEGIATGNIGGGIGNAAQAAFGPQMEFGRAMMDPNASNLDAFMKMQSEMAERKQYSPAQMPQMPAMQEMPASPMVMQNQQQSRMPMAQGLPQGLLAQMGYRR